MLLLQDGLAFFFAIKAYFEKSISLSDVFYISHHCPLHDHRNISANLTDLSTFTRHSSDYFDYIDDDFIFPGGSGRHSASEALKLNQDVSFKYPHRQYIFKFQF